MLETIAASSTDDQHRAQREPSRRPQAGRDFGSQQAGLHGDANLPEGHLPPGGAEFEGIGYFVGARRAVHHAELREGAAAHELVERRPAEHWTIDERGVARDQSRAVVIHDGYFIHEGRIPDLPVDERIERLAVGEGVAHVRAQIGGAIGRRRIPGSGSFGEGVLRLKEDLLRDDICSAIHLPHHLPFE